MLHHALHALRQSEELERAFALGTENTVESYQAFLNGERHEARYGSVVVNVGFRTAVDLDKPYTKTNECWLTMRIAGFVNESHIACYEENPSFRPAPPTRVWVNILADTTYRVQHFQAYLAYLGWRLVETSDEGAVWEKT